MRARPSHPALPSPGGTARLTVGHAGVPDPSSAALAELEERISPLFARPEPRRQAMLYVAGLLGGAERKSSWQIAEATGVSSPWQMQRLLTRARWDADAVRDVVRDYVRQRLGHPDGILHFGETAAVKRGSESVAVARQFSEAEQQVRNCQLGVFTGYVSHRGAALVDRELYLPEAWTAEPERCRAAGVPDERITAATRADLAARMVERLHAADLPVAWVSGGAVYGRDRSLRARLERRRLGYVLAMPLSERVVTPAHGAVPVASLAGRVPRGAWKRCPDPRQPGSARSAREEWARVRVLVTTGGAERGTDVSGSLHSVLLRRPAGRGSDAAFYLVYDPYGADTAETARAARAEQAMRDCLRAATRRAGLARSEVRTWTAWYRHVTLALLAAVSLAVP